MPVTGEHLGRNDQEVVAPPRKIWPRVSGRVAAVAVQGYPLLDADAAGEDDSWPHLPVSPQAVGPLLVRVDTGERPITSPLE